MTSQSPQSSPMPSPSESKGPSRRTSFGFLHRSKSKERLRERKVSGNKISKKQYEQARDEELRRLQDANLMPKTVPKLPDLTLSPQLQSFGGEDSMHNKKSSTDASAQKVPVPPVPATSRGSEFVDPYARTESMTHRGRYSYAASLVSSIDSPRRVRRRKDPSPYK